MNRCKTAETLFQVVAVTVPNLITYLLTYCHEA